MRATRRSLTRREFVGSALGAAGVVAGAPAILRGQNLNNKLNLADHRRRRPRRGQPQGRRLREHRRALRREPHGARRGQGARIRTRERSPTSARSSTSPPTSTRSSSAPASTRTRSRRCWRSTRTSTSTARSRSPTTSGRRGASARPPRRRKVATQMGIQIHAGDNYRRVVELVQSGAIGPVREAHVWVVARVGPAERRGGRHATRTSCS